MHFNYTAISLEDGNRERDEITGRAIALRSAARIRVAVRERRVLFSFYFSRFPSASRDNTHELFHVLTAAGEIYSVILCRRKRSARGSLKQIATKRKGRSRAEYE